MPIRSLSDLRKQAGADWKDSTDEDLISAYAQSVELDPVQVARQLGYDPGSGGKTAKRFSASADNYQAGLYGLGEAVTGALGLDTASEWLGERRRANELQANVASSRAKSMGAIDSYKDVGGVGDAADYVAGLAIQSGPYIAESALGGLAARGAMSGTRAALRGAIETGDEVAAAAARSTLSKGSLLGGATASYPSSVGDILQNQREQAGTTDLVSAGLGGVPYVGFNLLGIEGAAARGQLFRSGVKALDDIPGVKGGLARATVSGLKTGVSEGVGELGQEFVNQAGRMSVDPNEEFFSEGAKDRFAESFVGGFALGKVSGSALGGWRKSGNSLLGGANDQLSGTSTPDTDAIRQAINTGPNLSTADLINQLTGVQRQKSPNDAASMQAALNEKTGVYVSGTNQIERELTAGDLAQVNAGLSQPTAGQATAPAATAQQGAQPTQGGQQAPQVDPQVLAQTGQRYGLTPRAQDKVSSVEIGGRLVIGVNNIQAFLGELATLDAQKTDVQRTVEAALMKVPGLVKVNPTTGTAKGLSAAATKAAEKFQLTEAATVEDAAEIINAQIEALANAGKGQTDTNVTNLAQAYEALTGQMAPAYELTQQNVPKKGTTVPKTNTTSTQGVVNGQVQEQVSPGLGAVPVTGGAPESSGNGNVQPAYVQPVEPGSDPGRQNLLQDEPGGEAGARVGSGGTVSPDVLGGSSSQAQASIETAEGTLAEKEAFVLRLFNAVFGARDGKIVYELYEQVGNATEIGKNNGLSPSRIRQIKSEYFEKEVKGQALEFKPKWAERIVAEARAEGLIEEDIATFLGGDEQVSPGEVVNDLEATELADDTTPQTAEETVKAKFDEEIDEDKQTADRRDGNLRIVDEKNVSAIGDVSEKNQSGSKFKDAVAKQKAKGAENPEAEALKSLSDSDLQNLALKADANRMQLIANELKRRAPIRASKREKGELDDDNATQEPAATQDKPVEKKPKAPEKQAETKPASKEEKPATAQEAWDRVASEYPNAPKWADLTDEQRATFTEYGEDNWTPEDVQSELIKLAKASPTGTGRKGNEQQIKNANEHADELGGEVVYQDGDLALIRGYSVISGAPVYVPAKGDRRGVVDIARITGNKLITEEEKQTLLVQKERLETEAAKKHQDKPFIKFENGLAVSDGVSPRLAGVVRGWKQLLNLNVNIYVTTLEDAKTNRNSFTGPHRVIGSATLDANERGSMRRMTDGSYYVTFTKSTSLTKMLEILAHEMGHVHQREVFDNAPDSVKGKIRDEFDKWLSQTKGKTGRELVDSMRARQTARMTEVPEGQMADKMSLYWKSFSEWYADQVSRWAVASKKPQGVVEQFFAKLAIALRKFYSAVKNAGYLPTETFREYLDEIAPKLVIVPKNSDANADLSSNAIFAGAKSTGFDEGKAAQARVRQAAGEDAKSVFNELGHFIGPDGKVRYEIDDRKAQVDTEKLVSALENGQTIKLAEVLDHPELYEAYPELKNTVITLSGNTIDANAVFPIEASITPGVNAIALNNIPSLAGLAAVKSYGLVGFDEQFKSALLHETQHLVQITEGFSGGGSPLTAFAPENDKALKELYDHTTEYANRYEQANQPEIADEIRAVATAIQQIRRLARINPKLVALGKQKTEVIRRYAALDAQAKNDLGGLEAVVEANDTDREIFQLLEDKIGLTPEMYVSIKDWAYTALAGETEARDVESRSRRLPEERTLTPRLADPREKVVTNYESQVSQRNAAAIDRLPPAARSQAQQIFDTISDFAKKGLPTLAFTNDLADMAEKYLSSARKFVNLFNQQRAIKTEYELRVTRILNAYNRLPADVKGTGPNSVNKFLKDSTTSGKWGYKIKADSPVTPDPDLKARFEAFPKEAQELIKSVFKHGYDTLQDMKKAVLENVNTEFDALIKIAQDANDAAEVAALQLQKKNSITQYTSLLSIAGKKPYAPLKRFGNYVVVGRSQAYLDAEKNSDRKEVEKLQKDEKHYFVQFAETFGEAKALEREEAGRYALVQAFEKDTASESIYGGNDLQQVFFRIKSLAKEVFDDKTNQVAARGINKLINDLHLSMLAENAARQSENRRKNIAGADDDMMRAFATQGRAQAHFIGSLTNTGKIYETLREMKSEADARTPGRDERRRYYNEFMKRHAMGFDYKPSPVLDKALATTSGWMLLSNPAYFLQNLTQPLMMSVPYMAGKHSYGRANSELFKAYREVSALLKTASVDEKFDFSKLPEDVRDMMEELVKRGRIDISLEQDLGDWRSTEDSKFPAFGKTINFLRSTAQKIEMINRVATAIAAYRLEKARNAGDLSATNYADKVIRVTHGDYSGANAPRFMRNGLGRLMTQFRKFQLIQISMIARLFNDAFKGATKEERAAAKQALLWTLTHAGVAGGIMGLPGFYAIAAVFGALFGDDDEPDNPELTLRRLFGEEFGTLMTKGLPAALGVDVSGKIGMGQMLSLLPYADIDLSKKGWETAVTAAAGPFVGGLMPRAIDGLSQMGQGNYYKGIELLMPSGVANAMKGYRFASEGVTLRNNDKVLSPEEVSFLDATLQGLGLPTTKITERQFRQGVQIEFEQFFNDRTTELKRQYARAYRDNDASGMQEARDSWNEMQDARVREGFKRQPLSNLLKSPMEQAKRERDTAGGVQFNRGNRRFVEELPQ